MPVPRPHGRGGVGAGWAMGAGSRSSRIPTGQRAARGERARVRGHVCGRRGHVRGQGGAGASPRADGHSLMKRWRWPCQLSPSPWTNGCLTCLWGQKHTESERPPRVGGHGGLGTPLVPSSIRSSRGVLMSPWPPQSPSRAGVPPGPPLTWMLTSSLHCLRVSRRSTSTLGTTWGGEALSRRRTRTGRGTQGSAPTFTAQTFSFPQSSTLRMVPKEPLATKPRI